MYKKWGEKDAKERKSRASGIEYIAIQLGKKEREANIIAEWTMKQGI